MTGVPLPAGGFGWQAAGPAGAACSAAAGGAATEGPWVDPVTTRVVPAAAAFAAGCVTVFGVVADVVTNMGAG